VAQSGRLSAGVKWAALGLVIALVTTLLLAATEGAIRLRQWSKHGTSSSFDSLYRVDPSIGLRVLVPGARVGNISVNSLGFRGPEIETAKPPGRVRIAFLGASTTFCAEVSGDTAVWPQVAVERLKARFPGVEFDFVNGAVPGYTVESSLKNLQHRVGPLQPDVVVIYHATNDLSVEARQLAEQQGLIAPRRSHEPSWLAQNLRLWELAEKNLRVLVARQGAEGSKGRVAFDGASLGGAFRTDLSKLVEAAGQDGRRVAVATFSARLRPEQSVEERKQAAVSALVYMPFMSLDALIAGYARYNDHIRAVVREKGALLIDGEDLIPGDAVHFADSVHFTDAGSRAMGERIANGLAADTGFLQLIARRKSDRG
jgi:lysophospholipase L1-like esterase